MQATAFSQLVEFGNRYVLDDRVIIYDTALQYAANNDMEAFQTFLNKEITSADSVVEIPPKNLRFPARALEAATTSGAFGESQLSQWIYNELSRCAELELTEAGHFGPAEHEVRVIHLTMLLSDYMSCDFVLQGMAAVHALRTYRQFLIQLSRTMPSRRPFHPEFRDFRNRFKEIMRSPVSYEQMQTLKSPSFLLEALRQSDSPAGVFHVLREFRYSAPATRYRNANRTRHFGANPKVRVAAQAELRGDLEESFSAVGLKSRVPQWAISSVSLSSAAIALLFHGLAPAATLTVPALLTGDYTSQLWFGQRRNVFTNFFAEEGDLYTELHRIWGPLLCTREQLASALAERTRVTEQLEAQADDAPLR
jgi:hypothetical protein